jgi:hypothetical protein
MARLVARLAALEEHGLPRPRFKEATISPRTFDQPFTSTGLSTSDRLNPTAQHKRLSSGQISRINTKKIKLSENSCNSWQRKRDDSITGGNRLTLFGTLKNQIG